jgi:hypothetical protein
MLILNLCKTTLRKHKKQNKTLTLHWQTEKDSQGEFELKKKQGNIDRQKKITKRDTHTHINSRRKKDNKTYKRKIYKY